MVFLVVEMTLTAISSFTLWYCGFAGLRLVLLSLVFCSFFCLSWMNFHILSAAGLAWGEQSRCESTISQSLNESVAGSFCSATVTMSSHCVGLGLTVKLTGTADWPGVAETICSQPSSPPW